MFYCHLQTYEFQTAERNGDISLLVGCSHSCLVPKETVNHDNDDNIVYVLMMTY